MDIARVRRAASRVGIVNQYGSTETQQALAYHVVPLPPSGAAERLSGAFDVFPAGRVFPMRNCSCSAGQ